MDHRGSITEIELECMLLDENAEPMALPFPLLEKITHNFSDKLEIGRGGFAVVYKAMLENEAVAIKRLSNTYMYEKEFQREVECLIKAKHKNIVRFLGYCADTQGNMESYNGKMVMADVQQRLLCFEYLPKGSLDGYITDSSKKLEWRKCYKVIKGICEGLNYLHQTKILHLDLKPGNILLGGDMMPKITDFGLSRCFEEDQTRVVTKNVGGTMGYLAPEFCSGEITHKFDLYSLGVIIIEMLTGKKGYQTIENVLAIWNNAMLDTLQWEQIRVCAEIGIECIEVDPSKRPASMKHIIDRLAELECSTGASDLLLLQQFVLCFPFEPNKAITCPLQLTNNTDKHVVFGLMDKSMGPSFLRLPLYGFVPPNTPYTLMVTTQEKEDRPRKYIIDVILHSATLILGDDEHIKTFQNQPDRFFREMGNAVREVKLKALYTLPRHNATLPSKPTSPSSKIILCNKNPYGNHLASLDMDQCKQRIIIGNKNGHVQIWDYRTQRKKDSIRVSATYEIKCVKFIARKQWIVVGTNIGNIYVYDYEKMQKIASFRVGRFQELKSLAVHPTHPYLLSAGTNLKLWNWDKRWECVQTFELEKLRHVAFSQNDTFAASSDSEDYTVTVGSLGSPKSNCILFGHSDKVKCLDFFTYHNQEFLVTGSNDKTAKIWYLREKICAYTLRVFESPVTSVLYQSNLEILLTGSKDGAIYFWSTTDCRIYSCPPMLKRIIKTGCDGAIYHLACAMGRVVIGKKHTVAIMDFENVNYEKESIDYGEKQLSADTRQQAGDTMSKEISGSISQLPILDVHPPEIRFPYHPEELIPCSLHLTNNTDENVAFRLVDRSGKSPWCFTKLPLYGILSRRSTYNLIVTTKEEMKLKEEKDFDLVIQSNLLRDKHISLFKDQSEFDQYFEEAKEFGNMVHEVKLKVIYVKYREITYEDTTVKYNPDNVCCLDAHPTEPWILTGHCSGYAHAWNHEMKYPMNSFEVSEYYTVSCVKFIARMKWIVAMTPPGNLHVYDCACVTNIENITTIEPSNFTTAPILAVHPSMPYVLSPDTVLLDWELRWMRTQTFRLGLMTVAFNPWDAYSFASGSLDGYVEVWRLDSSDPEYFLPGHMDVVNCLDFITRGDQQYVITGSEDCTAKIWDLQKRECIRTLEATSPVLCVLVHPYFPLLIIGAAHGIIQLWSSIDFRLKRTINLGGGGPVVGLACLSGSRILIGQKNAIVTMDLCESWGVTSDESSETPNEWSETSEECPELEEHTVSSREENPIVGRGVKAMTPATTTVHQGDKEGGVGSTQPKRQRLS
ncbi:uncharacterized protein LOC119288251 isoform X2 [Triticum dicoccoides]|uniref:uncharacterized protein LOC119288251 isoform X2 n=1 Tax=Triticum dicoccoides TaxID=85692 RepID=UPI00188EE38D|nr:uncharacterized protein LOC119288251 isoform X2 [Triticum dicoccoides]